MAFNSEEFLPPGAKIFGGSGGGGSIENNKSIVELVFAGRVSVVAQALEKAPGRINEICPIYNITPIFAAAGHGMPRMTELLLSVGGLDLTRRDGRGRTAFDMAAPFPDVLAQLMEYRRGKKPWQEPAPKMPKI